MFTTLGSAGRRIFSTLNSVFDFVLIDEAAQAGSGASIGSTIIKSCPGCLPLTVMCARLPLTVMCARLPLTLMCACVPLTLMQM